MKKEPCSTNPYRLKERMEANEINKKIKKVIKTATYFKDAYSLSEKKCRNGLIIKCPLDATSIHQQGKKYDSLSR